MTPPNPPPEKDLQAYQMAWLNERTLPDNQIPNTFFYQPPNPKKTVLYQLDPTDFQDLIKKELPSAQQPNQIRILMAVNPAYRGGIADQPPFTPIIQSYRATNNAEVPPVDQMVQASFLCNWVEEVPPLERIPSDEARAMVENWVATNTPSEIESAVVHNISATPPIFGRVKAFIFGSDDVTQIQQLAKAGDSLYLFLGINVNLVDGDPYLFRPILKVGPPVFAGDSFFEFAHPCPPACNDVFLK